MKFTQIPTDTFKEIQLNAGVLLKEFTPSTAAVSGILGATSGGVTFTAQPTFSDYGSDIDNCPKNLKELKKLESYEAKMSGTFITINPELAKTILGAADVSGDKIVPRNDVLASDFTDIWWVGDYSDNNGSTGGGFVAIHMMNALSTGGFQLRSADKGKGQFTFEFTAHYSNANADTVPFELYIKEGTASA